jgi:hypothetical protein
VERHALAVGAPFHSRRREKNKVRPQLRHASSRVTLDVYAQALTPAKREAQKRGCRHDTAVGKSHGRRYQQCLMDVIGRHGRRPELAKSIGIGVPDRQSLKLLAESLRQIEPLMTVSASRSNGLEEGLEPHPVTDRTGNAFPAKSKTAGNQ